MRRLLFALAAAASAVLAMTVYAAELDDVKNFASCKYCGMNRDKFAHSRMVIEYEGGGSVGTCSLHCTAVELANAIDRTPAALRVADYESKGLLDAEKAVWVMGGSKSGVMTNRAKWAFASSEAAGRFIKEHGGAIASFEETIKASYDDMYQDTKMIRDRRKAKRLKLHGMGRAN